MDAPRNIRVSGWKMYTTLKLRYLECSDCNLGATDQLYQPISKFHNKQQRYDPETNLLCDLALESNGRKFARDTSSCNDDQLPQTISKFHHKQHSYGSETNTEQTDGRTVGRLLFRGT